MLFSLLKDCLEIIPMVFGCAFFLRFWAQRCQAGVPLNIARYLVRMTDWFVVSLQKILSAKRGSDWTALAGGILVAWLAAVLDAWLFSVITARLVVFLTLASLLRWIFYGLMAMLLIEAVLSWVNPYASLAFFIHSMTEPLIRPVRRMVPTLGRFDFSPMIVFFLLHVGLKLILQLLSELTGYYY